MNNFFFMFKDKIGLMKIKLFISLLILILIIVLSSVVFV